jgi:hypothetical protein
MQTGAALNYQLEVCRTDGNMTAMVIADTDGLALATSGDSNACEEIAARIAVIGSRINEFTGTLYGPGQLWDVQMKKLIVDNMEFMVCAIGGTAEQRSKQVGRGVDGAGRILAAT